MPPYDPLNFNFWNTQTRESAVKINCLMPNGLCIERRVSADTPLRTFKSDLWEEAKRLPLCQSLKDSQYYVLSCVDRYGGIEELVDENRSIYDVQPFKPYFKVVEKQGDETEKLFNSKISMLIGKSIADFETMEKDDEVRTFRKKYRTECQTICAGRRRANWDMRAMYAYPPQFADSVECPKYLESKLRAELIVKVYIAISMGYDFRISHNCSVKELIQISLNKKRATMPLNHVENPDDYVFKIAGRNSFLFAQIEDGIEPKLLHFQVSYFMHHKKHQCLQNTVEIISFSNFYTW